MGANYVAKELGYAALQKKSGPFDVATNAAFEPIETFKPASRICSRRSWGPGSEPWTSGSRTSTGVGRRPSTSPSPATSSTPRRPDRQPGRKLRCVHDPTSSRPAGSPTRWRSTCSVVRDVLRLDRPGAESVLREYGVRFGYENHPESSPQEVLELIGDADDVLGAAVDTGWWATQGYDPVQAIRRPSGRLFHVHLKDVEAADTHISCMHGEGVARIADCVRRARRRGLPRRTERRARAVRPRSDRRSDQDAQPARSAARSEGGRSCLTAPFVVRSSAAATSPAPTERRRRPTQASRSPARRTSTGRSVRRSSSGSVGSTTLTRSSARRSNGRRRRQPDRHGIHAEVTAAALEAGKHVHSEKPMASNYAEARGLVSSPPRRAYGCPARRSRSWVTHRRPPGAWSPPARSETSASSTPRSNWGGSRRGIRGPSRSTASDRWRTSASTRSRS